MRTRFFRALVCLVLVAALLVQVSPIRARAAGPNFFFVDPELQLASDLIGLGISVGTDAAAHNQVIQDAADWLAETGEWLSEGMLKVYKVAAAAGGCKYMVDGDFLQELFEWMFDTVVVDVIFPSLSLTTKSGHFAYSEVSYTLDIPFEVFSVCLYDGTSYWPYLFIYSESYFDHYYGSDGALVSTHTVSSNGAFFSNVCSWSKHASPDDYFSSVSGFYDLGVVSFGSGDIQEYFKTFSLEGLSGEVTTSKDLTLNHVGVFGSILPDSYPEWFQNSTTITDSETGEPKTVVPVALGQTVTETQGMSQTDVWAGTSTYVDTETDVGTGDDTITVPETVTLKDILTGILSVPKSIAQAVAAFFADVVAAVKAIPAAITEFFTISADVSAFAIEWRDFFPFCIPFDIYDFLTLLMADPEAPKFEWEIDLLKTGEPYLMVVDLSEWDDVAQLLRRLELLVFIVGLAMVTREKYIRG